ncbi:MAG: LysM peptidoglycan-binding domain-containing protein, partial [Deltaproteobacteria bacterium]|nr:LysM peptidoglycan-binding domain-containing protein [Deltaproteobacteria bacterium]
SDGTARKGKGGVHLVKPRETLWRIARDYNTTVGELIRLNNLRKSWHVRAGKKLLLP